MIPGDLKSGRRAVREKCDSERTPQRNVTLLVLKAEEGGREPRNVGGLWKPEKAREEIHS